MTHPPVLSRAAIAVGIGFSCMMIGQAVAGPLLVVDASTGAVLKSEEATRPWHPASTTKMMTIYVALKAVKAGRIGLETAIPASALAAKQPRVKAYIRKGQEITLDNALKIMMVKSANDISYVIAEGVGGNVESFVATMNAEARRLGMRETVFANPNGWHHPQQQTSARDLATLAIALMREFPEYADYWNIGAVQLGKTVMKNTNGLVGRYQGINGFKTGFVCASGFNVVASATRGGRTLIAVVLGALSGAERTVVAAQSLDEAFASWGGNGYTLASLPGSGYSSATNICEQVRTRGGGAALADDFEAEGPIAYQATFSSDNGMADRFAAPAPQQAARAGARTAGGRYALGPRTEFAPLAVAFGRTAGSARAPLAANVAGKPQTQVAGTEDAEPAPAKPRTVSLNGAIPVAASAFAATGAATTGPLKLQGATSGTASVPLRPGAAAGIRPAPKPAAKQTAAIAGDDGKAKPSAAKPAKPQGTQPKVTQPKANQSKATAGKPAADKANAKTAQAKPKAGTGKTSAQAKPTAATTAAEKPKPATADE